MLRSDEIVAFGLSRMPRRARESAERATMRAVVGTVGVRARLIPRVLRQQFELIGIDAATLERALGTIRRPSDWPYAWEAEGDRRYAAGDLLTASGCYYMAQRTLMAQTPLKRRLYDQGSRVYVQAPMAASLEPFTIQHGGETIAAFLQIPADAIGPAPLVVMVPGMTATKEEFHPFAEALLRAGFAVARIDNPGYGHTTGVIGPASSMAPAAVVEYLGHDPRIDHGRMHLMGTSMGGAWAAISSTEAAVQSLTIVAAPFNTYDYFNTLPSTSYVALRTMTGLDRYSDLRATATNDSNALDVHARNIRVPVRIMHGAKDGTVPVREAGRFQREIPAPTLVTIYARARHNCLEHFDDVIAELTDWSIDAAAVLERAAARGRLERMQRAEATALLRTSGGEMDGSLEPGVA